MIELSISEDLRAAAPHLALGCVQADVRVKKKDPELWNKLCAAAREAADRYGSTEALAEAPPVAATADAFRAMGKDPKRYRASAEALVRRALQGKDLYQINTVVDVNNLVSVESMCSVGSYDVGRLTPPLTMRIGREGESYPGIGKGEVNVSSQPLFADAAGPYGSPTSDSKRAMISTDTQTVLMVVMSFREGEEVERWTARAAELLAEHCGGRRIEEAVIR